MKNKKRVICVSTPELRAKLKDIVMKMHDLFKRKHLPKAVKKKCCQSCSIKDLCLPALGEADNISVMNYLEMHLK